MKFCKHTKLLNYSTEQTMHLKTNIFIQTQRKYVVFKYNLRQFKSNSNSNRTLSLSLKNLGFEFFDTLIVK